MLTKRKKLALILALSLYAVAGTEITNLTEANPEGSVIKYSLEIEITSPVNKTYNTNMIQLNISAWHVAGSTNPWEVMYSVDGGPFVVVYSGKSKITVESSMGINLSDGTHTIVAKAYDGAYVCTNVALTVDKTPPYLSFVLPENLTYRESEILLDFTVDGLSDSRYSLDGKAPVSLAGNTSLKGVTDGSHIMILYGTTENGSVFASEPVYFGVNAERQKVSILSIKNNTTYYNSNLDLIFHLSEPSPKITYVLDDQIGITISGNVTLSDLPYGSHRLRLYAEDSLEYYRDMAEVYFNIEPSPIILLIVFVMIVIIGSVLLVYFKKRKH